MRSGSLETGTVIDRFSGPVVPSSLFSTTHETTLFFHSDYSQNKPGFHIVYQGEDEELAQFVHKIHKVKFKLLRVDLIIVSDLLMCPSSHHDSFLKAQQMTIIFIFLWQTKATFYITEITIQKTCFFCTSAVSQNKSALKQGIFYRPLSLSELPTLTCSFAISPLSCPPVISPAPLSYCPPLFLKQKSSPHSFACHLNCLPSVIQAVSIQSGVSLHSLASLVTCPREPFSGNFWSVLAPILQM